MTQNNWDYIASCVKNGWTAGSVYLMGANGIETNIPVLWGVIEPEQYPELTEIAEDIVNAVAVKINAKAAAVKSEMPHKAQFILEEVIRLLQESV